MDLFTYLTTPATTFGAFAWAFFIAQIAAAVAGIYLAFLRSDSHPVRGPLLRRLGYTLLVLGALGTLFGALRLAAVEPFTARYWFYGLAVVELALAGYTLFYARVTYPAQRSAFEQASRSRAGQRGPARPQPSLQANGDRGDTSFVGPRQAVAGGRRDARRDRKRRSR